MSSLRKLLMLFWAIGMYTRTWKVWIDANMISFLLQIWEARICEWTNRLLFTGVDLSVEQYTCVFFSSGRLPWTNGNCECKSLTAFSCTLTIYWAWSYIYILIHIACFLSISKRTDSLPKHRYQAHWIWTASLRKSTVWWGTDSWTSFMGSSSKGVEI